MDAYEQFGLPAGGLTPEEQAAEEKAREDRIKAMSFWQDGEERLCFITGIEKKESRNGNPYFLYTLRDATGQSKVDQKIVSFALHDFLKENKFDVVKTPIVVTSYDSQKRRTYTDKNGDEKTAIIWDYEFRLGDNTNNTEQKFEDAF